MKKMRDEFEVFDLEEIKIQTGWPDRIYRRRTLAKMFDVSVNTITGWVHKGLLPKPFKLNTAQYCLGWKASEIHEVMNNMRRF